jgi:hypothetical protein
MAQQKKDKQQADKSPSASPFPSKRERSALTVMMNRLYIREHEIMTGIATGAGCAKINSSLSAAKDAGIHVCSSCCSVRPVGLHTGSWFTLTTPSSI